MKRTPLLLTVLLLVACARGAGAPFADAWRRPAALRFGMHVTPDPGENPIDPPERFAGYHAGLDYEILPGEEDDDVPVLAICAGDILYTGFAEGYGGLIVQHCRLRGEDVTVMYGHLAEDGLSRIGAALKTGDRLGLLAPPYSAWSGGNRKHLHLGIHRGTHIDMRGYVQDPEELAAYIDPGSVLGWGAAGRPVGEFRVATSH